MELNRSLSILFVYGCIAAVAPLMGTKNRDVPESPRMRSELDEIWTILDSQQYTNSRLENVIQQQGKTISGLHETVLDQANTIQLMEKTIQEHDKSIKHEMTIMLAENDPDLSYEASSSGCLFDVITLACVAGRKINVTSAIYGKYATLCDDDCCSPNPLDCSESAEESTPGIWLAIKADCDNQTTCSYQYEGIVINSCETGYVADYMQINYDCWADSVPNDPAAFTAYAIDTVEYSSGERVLFEGNITNAGNHYDPVLSVFTCPFNGLYGFSIEFSTDVAESLNLEIYLNDEFVIAANADDNTGFYSHSSGMTVLECSTGQEVTVRAGSSGTIGGGSARFCHFSGFLILRY